MTDQLDSIELMPLPVGMKPDGNGWRIVRETDNLVTWERRRDEITWPRPVYANLDIVKQIDIAFENERDLCAHFDSGNSQYHGQIMGLLQRCKAKIEAQRRHILQREGRYRS